MNPDLMFWISGAGFVLLALGGEAVIRGGVMVKRALGISPVIIGLFVLSVGTSSSTLAVAINASANRIPDLALGIILGAVLINLLLVLGLSALIRPMPSAPKVVLRDGGTLLVASVVLVLLAHRGIVGRRDGLVLVGAFLLYAVVAIVSDWRRSAEHSVSCAEAEKRTTGEHPTVLGGLFVLIIGGICLLIGAHFLTGGTLALASAWKLPIASMAVTVGAIAVSLPVLIVTVAAALRGHTQIAIGHLLVASIFDLFGALGLAALVRPLRIASSFASLDVFVVLGASMILMPLLATNWRLTRPKGALLLLAYLLYVGYLAYSQGLLPAGFLHLV